MNKFALIDESLARGPDGDSRDATAELLATGVREGTLFDVAKTVGDHFGYKPEDIVIWYTQVLKCRVQQAVELLQKMFEMSVSGGKSSG